MALGTVTISKTEGQTNKFYPLSPNIHIQILQTDLYLFC